MNKKIRDYVEKEKETVSALFAEYSKLEKQFLLRSEISEVFAGFCKQKGAKNLCNSALGELFRGVQEATFEKPWFYIAVRKRVAQWMHYRFFLDSLHFEEVSLSQYLAFRELLVNGDKKSRPLEIDMEPFNRNFPKMFEQKSIGRGVEFLNRKLSSRLFAENERGIELLFKFLRVHQYKGRQLMLNDILQNVNELRNAIREAESFLETKKPGLTWNDVRVKLKSIGFEAGWGRTVSRILETLSLLSDILEAPEPKTLEEFLGRIPMIFRIVIISPHGFFSQGKVLGFPDTGGQVVYILDQVRAIEKEMIRSLHEQGFDMKPEIVVVTRLIPEARGTTCDQEKEEIIGTENARIIRVPFHNDNGEICADWISRFKIWPYLERFADDAANRIVSELVSRPDLIIGNYSDGNLVASILAHKWGVTQCNIAHALEKAKYLYSDLLWKGYEENFNFSCQITADLISMNSADFIVTSTYQEIGGDKESLGQYESFQAFTMPGLYRVVNGINVYDPKFNIVSPGADSDIYFPYFKKKKRLENLEDELSEMVFGKEKADDKRGILENPGKPIIFTMARMDRIKNITGLVESYGQSKRLRKLANLFIISGHVNPDLSIDDDERDQINHMHHLFNEYGLDGEVRWYGAQLSKATSGELYRFIADRRGVFAQPALFEAFGLTVIEAMSTGLPTFATMYGGPLEIIKHGTSGFHLDPNNGEKVAKTLADFFVKTKKEPSYWEEISKGGLERVEKRYNWKLYAERIMTLSRVYGFWRYVTNLERDETKRYLEMFYALQFRKLVENAPR